MYTIEVPLYNASFKTADNVKVRLSYSKTLSGNVKQIPANDLHLIQDKNISLKGWNNQIKSIADRKYYFYVQVDPDNEIHEVHESRMENGQVKDCGGDNEGVIDLSVREVL